VLGGRGAGVQFPEDRMQQARCRQFATLARMIMMFMGDLQKMCAKSAKSIERPLSG
jgi:hypothetical protein